MSSPKHPAKFSDPIVATLDRLVRAEAKRRRADGESGFLKLLDPFAGTGKISKLHRPGHVEVVGVEIEPEWAAMCDLTICADSIAWMRARARRGGSGRFSVIATSPTYGNRFADSHDPKDPSVRHGYKFDLGRMPSDGSSSTLPWGPRYWSFHAEAYRAMLAVLEPGGLALLNVSNFYRQKALVNAVEWHIGAAFGAGFEWGGPVRWVETRRHTHGANRERDSAEAVLSFRKAAA